MKREEIKSIFPDATDEQLKSIMDLHGSDVEKMKSKVTALEADLKSKTEDFDKLNTDFENLKVTNASSEEWKTKFENFKAEVEKKNKEAEEAQKLAEKNADIKKRFDACRGEKEFSHDAIADNYLKRFGEALESEEYKGKGDAEIFHALTKDDAKAFAGVNVTNISGGRDVGSPNVDDAKARAIMGLK